MRILREQISLEMARSSASYTTLINIAKTTAIDVNGIIALLDSCAFHKFSSTHLKICESGSNHLGV
jgi:hypothetical protein